MFNRNARNRLSSMGGIASFSNGGATSILQNPTVINALNRRGIPTSSLGVIQSQLPTNNLNRFLNQNRTNTTSLTRVGGNAPKVTLTGEQVKQIARNRLNQSKFPEGLASFFTPEKATSPGGFVASSIGKGIATGADKTAQGIANLLNIFKPFSGMTPGVRKELQEGGGNIDLTGVDQTKIPRVTDIEGYEKFKRPIGMIPGTITKIVPEGSKGPKPFPETKPDQAFDMTTFDVTQSTDALAQQLDDEKAFEGTVTGIDKKDDKKDDKKTVSKKDVLTAKEQLDDEKAFEGTVDPQAKDAIQVADVIQRGKPEDQQAELRQLMQEFKQNAPKYKGVDRGLAIAKVFFSMAAGKDPDAITNIAEALKQGADDAIKDKKSRDAFERQVDLAALQYGVAEIGKRRAQDRLDQRTFTDFVVGKGGLTFKGVAYEEGDTFRFSTKDYMDNGGKLPKNIMDKAFASKYQAAIDAKNKSFNDLQKDLFKKRFLTSEAQRKYKNDYADAVSKASSAETAGSLLESVIMRAPEIVGGYSSAKQVGANFFAFFGAKAPKGYDAKQVGVNDLRAALQDVVKVTLGSTQSANSISNRDVEFLIQGFLSDGIISRNENGTFDFSLAGTTQKVFINSLQKGLRAVRKAQAENLNAMTAIENELVGAYTFTGGDPRRQILDPIRKGATFTPGGTLKKGQTTKTLSFNEKDNLYFVPKA